MIFSLQIYTFGPTFRAENSNTSRHLAEFWVFEILKPVSLESDINTEFTSFAVLLLWVKMIEPELAFADLNDDMACATAYLQYVVGAFLYHFCLIIKSSASHFCSVALSKSIVVVDVNSLLLPIA